MVKRVGGALLLSRTTIIEVFDRLTAEGLSQSGSLPVMTSYGTLPA